MALPYTRAEVKERVKSTWHGCCNVTIPSMTSDFKGLNARAIEHDVRLAEEHGFWGTLVASESGLTCDEYVEFMEIARGAANNLKLVVHLSFDTSDEVVRAAKAAEALGYEAALVNYPDWFRPKNAADIVSFTREVAEQTDLALILFAVTTWGFKALHPSAFPPDALAEMARFQTAAAIKYEANPPAMNTGFADIRRRCGEHVLVECPLEHYAPGLVDAYGMQWMGTSSYESYGDRVPRWFKLLHDDRWDEGMALYWKSQPARDAKSAYHASFGGANLISRQGWKYMSWLQGYAGGMLRMPHLRILPNQMRALRAGFAASGFALPETDDAFYAGRFPTDAARIEEILAGAMP